MTYINALTSTLRSRCVLASAALAAALLIAGCGSSSSSSTITVGAEHSADNALATQTEAAAKKATSTTSTTATTPTSGPLSKKPVVTPPPPPPPKKLVIHEIIPGTGAAATAASSVTVNYVGVLFNGGKEFDSSWKRGEPATFALSAVIPGWTKGIPGMRVGGRRELVIPAALAYGAKGSPPTIPPNEPLVFVIDLLGV